MNKFNIGDTVVSCRGDKGNITSVHRFSDLDLNPYYYYSLDSTHVNFKENRLCLVENINNSNEFYINMMQDEFI